MDRTVGTCSICGGRVTLPAAWHSTVPPVPTCSSCGATQKRPYGPVIDMDGGRRMTPDVIAALALGGSAEASVTARAEALSDRHELLHNRDGKVEGIDR